MSKKLQGNGLFESTRMMLPEHKEAIIKHRQKYGRRNWPEIDEQEWEQIGSHLQQSMKERESITLELFDPFECKEEAGIVVDIDVSRRRVKLQQDGEWLWIRIEDIVEVL